ncbi:MAG: glycosyltransferase [Verrucomicrobia bacterium]|nr:glycosyltransferase [Verrucomicrobiota bacterium]MDA1088099.1 glycosyltransferase [Verrucomicrobiota bacterium]
MTAPARRVLFISPQPFYQWRGSPIRVAFDVQAIAELGFDVDLLTLPIGQDLGIEGVNVIRVANPFGVSNVPIGPSVAKLFFDLLLCRAAMSLARRHDYAVIHAVEDAGIIGSWVARRAKAKCIFEKHSDPASHRSGWLRNLILSLYHRVETSVIRASDAVIGTGPGLIEQARATGTSASLHHIFDIPSSRVEADPDDIASARRKLQSRDSDVVIMYVGSFAVYQGIDLMFEAMPRVLAEAPDARFVVIGGSAEQIARRRNALSALGLAERVHFLGSVHPDDLPAYLAASDILLSPRISGTNTPLKLLDYLKAGRAIVASDTPANRLILNPKIAVLAAAEPAAFAEAILGLCANPGDRTALASAGRQLIDDTYNYDGFKARLGECYGELLAEGTSLLSSP